MPHWLFSNRQEHDLIHQIFGLSCFGNDFQILMGIKSALCPSTAPLATRSVRRGLLHAKGTAPPKASWISTVAWMERSGIQEIPRISSGLRLALCTPCSLFILRLRSRYAQDERKGERQVIL